MIVDFEGKEYEFPDDTTDAEISSTLRNVQTSPRFMEVIRAIPGEAKRQAAGMVAGGETLIGDIVGSQEMVQRGLGVKKEIAAEAQLERPKDLSILEEGILSGGASALTQVPAVVAGAIAAPAIGLAGVLGAATTAMGLQTGLSKYGDERAAGFQPGRAAIHGMIEGLIEKYTEHLPLKELAGGSILWRNARNFLAKDFLGEQIATLGQDINAKLSDNPDLTLGDYFRNALVTAVATPVAGGLQLGTVSAGQAAVRALTPEPAPAPLGVPPAPGPAPLTPEPTTVPPPIAEAVGVPPPEPVAAAPATTTQPVELPKQETTVRAYLVGESENLFDVTFDREEATAVNPEPRYVDLPFDQLTALQEKVPESERSLYGGAARLPLPKDSSLIWKQLMVPPPAVAGKTAGEPVYVEGVDQPAVERASMRRGELPKGAVPLHAPGIKATSIQFPEQASKDLWTYGAALTRYETTVSPANTKQLNRMREVAKESNRIVDDAEAADLAQRYVYGVAITGLKKSKGGMYVAPPIDVAVKAQKDHEAHITAGIASKVKNGQVAISADLPYGNAWIDTMKTYLQAWVKTFSPQMRIVVLGEQAGTETRARTWYYGGTHYIYVPRQQDKVLALYVLAHEFGHMLISQHFNDPRYNAIKDKLIEEYRELLRTSMGGTAEEFVRAFRSPIDVLSGQMRASELAADLIRDVGMEGLTFDEWLADQLVRYMHTHQSHLQVAEAKEFWKPLFDTLKDFFTKVVKKFAPSQTYSNWVESLRFQDSQAATAVMAPPSPRVDKSVSYEANDQFEYTTRVLNRLPDKPNVKKVTIYGELGRADVRKEERELIGRILHDWPGETVDSTLFKERVLGEIIPLSLRDSDTYSAYGVRELGYVMAPNAVDRVSPRTHLWEARGLIYTSPHFSGEAASYWAHSRGFVTFNPPMSPGDIRRANAWNVIELQSDLEQHGELSVEDRTALNAELEEERLKENTLDKIFAGIRSADVEGVNISLGWLSPPLVGHRLTNWVTEYASMDLTSQEAANLRSNIFKEIDERTQDAITRRHEIEAALEVGTEVPQNLPKKWWELILRHEHTWAGREGYPRVRMATADTVAKVEGWPPEYRVQIPFLKDRVVTAKEDPQLPMEGQYTLTDQLVGAYNPENQNTTWWVLAKRADGTPVQLSIGSLGGTRNRDPGTFSLTAEIGKFITSPETRGQIRTEYGEMQGIYNRYAGDVTKFVKREFNAKPVTDEKGNTWLEWETNRDLADVPIVYYNTARATAETGMKVAEASRVPELPASYVRFQGFLNNMLQLNQLAKILPGVVGLQRFRGAMRNLHALKAKLFEGPNDRIHEWHKLGHKQAKAVEQALRDEQLSGSHWTALVQTEVEGKLVWVHTPTESFDKFMRERGIQKEGQDLFLGVKNDFLSTLSAMEEVVRQHINTSFEKNEIVLTSRLAQLDEEIKKLREMPYLPDTRFGKYSVQVRAGYPETVEGREIKEGELVYWEKFESERIRNRRLAELKRTLPGHNVSGSYDSELVSVVRGLPQELINALTETLNSDPSTALTPEQMNVLQQVAFDQTAAGKFAKYLGTPAKHLAGASKDMRRAYAAYHWKTANAIAKLKYFKSLTGAIQAVRQEAVRVRKEGGTSDPYDKLAERMQGNFNYVMTPQHEFEQLRAIVSMWYLWGSAKTAVMNMTSVPVLTFPYLGARFGDLQSTGAILRAIKDVTQYWRDPTKLSSDKQRVLEQLKADGVTDQSFASMLASVSDGGVAFEKVIPSWEGAGTGQMVDVARRTAWKVTSLGMMPFRVVEQFNRQITGLAAYDLMVAKTGKTLSSGDTEAYNFARDAVDHTQNEYGAWNRPPFMQGKQSVFLLFFSFVQNMSFMMFGGDKSWWRAMFVLAAMAGLQGLPGMDNLLDMLNWGLRKLTGQHVDLRNDAREVIREIGLNPDVVMHGISHSWLGLGWDTSSSLGAGRIIPGTDAIFGIGKFEDRFLHATSEIGGPVGSLLMSFLQALNDDNPSELLRWDRALPPVIRNIEKAYFAATSDAWVSGRGRPIAEEPTVTELVGQTLGFAPTRRTERQEELRAVKSIVEFYKERRTNLMEMFWAAKRTHDSETMGEVRARIANFNSSVPSPHLRISGEDISASMKRREQLDRETSTMRSPQKRYRDIYRYIDELY